MNANSEEIEQQPVYLLGISLHDKAKWIQLLICGGGFFLGYLINGIVEVIKKTCD